jgi:GNAT-family acetyltransferase (TIGR03103 family)
MPDKERLRHALDREERLRRRLERARAPTLSGWDKKQIPEQQLTKKNITVNCGWGRLIFGQTFSDTRQLAEVLGRERPGRRDITMYLRDPHVVIAQNPQGVFLDPSHTYRLWLNRYRPPRHQPRGFVVRLLNSRQDAEALCDLYVRQHMVPPNPRFVWENYKSKVLTYLVAEHEATSEIIGGVLGVDHFEAFEDPENGSSLWALAVDAQALEPGIGETLTRHLAEYYKARGRSFMDLSVMYNNQAAIHLYEKLGFIRIPVFALKHKNPYNEPLYIAPAPEESLNPYAAIIIREARRRGIRVDVLDAKAAYFALSFGGRTIVCRESLTELTSAIAMSRCDDKAVTHRVLAAAGLRVPAQTEAGISAENESFLERYGRVVVKPAYGEQGMRISVDIRTKEDLQGAVVSAQCISDRVLLEEFVEGEDLRIIVIDFKVVAAAVRYPPNILGDGWYTIKQLIKKQSRRRAEATGGESKIPLDIETKRCIRDAGYEMDSILPEGVELTVRKTANLHTGGSIHDVTDRLHPKLCEVAVRAAYAIDIPVVGLDLIVPSVEGEEYVLIEANERPGLANHEPQPTAERCIDLLFPQTVRIRELSVAT